MIYYIYYITTPYTTLFVNGVGGEQNFVFYFTNGHAESYIYPYSGIDRLTITPEIFDSGGIHSYGHVLFGGIK